MATGIDAHRVATRLAHVLERDFGVRLITRLQFEHVGGDRWTFTAHTDKQNAEITQTITPETFGDHAGLVLMADSLYSKLTEF